MRVRLALFLSIHFIFVFCACVRGGKSSHFFLSSSPCFVFFFLFACATVVSSLLYVRLCVSLYSLKTSGIHPAIIKKEEGEGKKRTTMQTR
jgi:uncharacterized membrane protein YciS (DUF1049 family)